MNAIEFTRQLRHTPRVSIGLPVFNGANHIAAALDSLLAQTYQDFEVIISDNASTDETRAICEHYAALDRRVRYVRFAENIGAARNFNHTFALASGEYFRWHAHDDVCAPTFLEKCVTALDAEPRAVLCFCESGFIDAYGRDLHAYKHPLRLVTPDRGERFLQFVLPGHVVVEIFGLIRASVLKRTRLIGCYIGSDLVLLGELALCGSFIVLTEQLFFHREHEQRSVHAHRDARARAAWFDGKRPRRFVFPTWRLLWEHFVSIWRVRMSASERATALVGMSRRANWSRAELAQELVDGLRLIGRTNWDGNY